MLPINQQRVGPPTNLQAIPNIVFKCKIYIWLRSLASLESQNRAQNYLKTHVKDLTLGFLTLPKKYPLFIQVKKQTY